MKYENVCSKIKPFKNLKTKKRENKNTEKRRWKGGPTQAP